MGVSVNDAMRTVTTFTVPRLGVFLCCLQHSVPGISHKFLIDSVYKTPIQNMDVLFASGIKPYYKPEFNLLFDYGDETDISKIQRNRAKFESDFDCMDWKMYHRNISILFADLNAEYFMLLFIIWALTLNP